MMSDKICFKTCSLGFKHGSEHVKKLVIPINPLDIIRLERGGECVFY